MSLDNDKQRRFITRVLTTTAIASALLFLFKYYVPNMTPPLITHCGGAPAAASLGDTMFGAHLGSEQPADLVFELEQGAGLYAPNGVDWDKPWMRALHGATEPWTSLEHETYAHVIGVSSQWVRIRLDDNHTWLVRRLTTTCVGGFQDPQKASLVQPIDDSPGPAQLEATGR
jgi:hypothetical protein